MKKLVLVLLVGVLGIATFGVNVELNLDNMVLLPEQMVLSLVGLRSAVGPIELGLSTPFLLIYPSLEGTDAGIIIPGLIWRAYGSVRFDIEHLYLFGRVEFVVPPCFPFGTVGLGLKFGNFFVEGDASFFFIEKFRTWVCGNFYFLDFGLLF